MIIDFFSKTIEILKNIGDIIGLIFDGFKNFLFALPSFLSYISAVLGSFPAFLSGIFIAGISILVFKAASKIL